MPSRTYPPPLTATLAAAESFDVWDGGIELWPGEDVELPSGRRLHLRRTPPAAQGASTQQFLFVHGLGGSAANWTDLAGLLAPLGEGIALDLPGFGRSPVPSRRDWSQTERIGAVIECIEHLHTADAGSPAAVHLVGNSMGGAMALAVAALRPDLVSTLTLVSPAVPDLRLVAQLRRSPMPLLLIPGVGLLAERSMSRMTPQQRVAATIAMCVGDPRRLSAARIRAAEAEAAERAAVRNAIRIEAASLRGLVRAQLRLGGRSMWALARRVQAPTLVVWGARDRLVSIDRAPRLCAELPDARLLVLPDAGHVAMIEQPVEVARAIASLVQRELRE